MAGPKNYSSKDMERYFNDPAYRKSLLQTQLSFIRHHRRAFLGGGFLLLALFVWYSFYVIDGIPSLEQLENPRTELATKIVSTDEKVIDQLQVYNRTRVSLDKLPPGLLHALLATEDKEFYNHWGVNAPRFIRQMILNIVTFRQAGASTITQQLARNLYRLKGDEESLFDKVTRKIREFISAVQIERNFTKKEILESYLNVAYFGRSAYGIESASQTYFDKPAVELNGAEYTMLIGMLKGPTYYDPINHFDRCTQRRDVVIVSMLRDGVISDDEAGKIRSDTLSFKLADPNMREGIAPHFVEWVRQQLVRKSRKYGFDLLRDGLKVYVTLDSRVQQLANRAVEEHMEAFQADWDSLWDWNKYPDILNTNLEKIIKESEKVDRKSVV